MGLPRNKETALGWVDVSSVQLRRVDYAHDNSNLLIGGSKWTDN